MTEYAHSKTGVDIHPGATIGALSTRGGQKLSGKKRHPTIGDNVTIYAGASILGGETVIGNNSIIGGNISFDVLNHTKDTFPGYNKYVSSSRQA